MRLRLSAVGWLREKVGTKGTMGTKHDGADNTENEKGVRRTPRNRMENFLQRWRKRLSSLSAAGARVVLRGGNVNNGANDGGGYVNVNNGLANANTNIGGRLAEYV